MNKLVVLITALTVVTVSCKKIKDKRLTIGDEKKMEVTDLGETVNTFYTENPEPGVATENLLDLDKDGVTDVKIRAYIGSETWVENEGDPLSWSISMEILNSNFSVREIVNSNKVYQLITSSADEVGDVLIEEHNVNISCENSEGASALFGSSYIMAGSAEGKFEEDNGVWSDDPESYGFIIAQSDNETLTITEVHESETSSVTLNTTIERNCYSVDKTQPVYVQFKTATEDYRLGWIEFIFDEKSYTINRHAISKKNIKV